MNATSVSLSFGRSNPRLAVALAGLVAGTLDILQACILFGWEIPKVIAAGLLGPAVIKTGGVGIYLLGLLLHFSIATTVAAIYYFASRRFRFLVEHPLVCGLFYGMAVEAFMNLIVLPLSALHNRGPYELQDLLIGYIVHMLVIGLPIAFIIRRFAR